MTILRTTIYAKREICTCDWKNTYEILVRKLEEGGPLGSGKVK